MKASQRRLVRQWQLVRVLNGTRRGLRIEELVERIECSRQTVYRDLEVLRDAGVPIHKHQQNGDVRYRLYREEELPPLGFNGLELAALHLARLELAPLAGTGMVRELDALLERLRPPEKQEKFFFAEKRRARPEVVRVLEQGLDFGRRLYMEYRARSRGGGASVVHVEPLFINVAGGEPYLRAYSVERRAERTYKLARIEKVKLTEEPCAHRSANGAREGLDRSAKVWSGETARVVVKLDREVAWLAEEYALISDQAVERRADGSAMVTAVVAGIVEAEKWVLSWGGAAEALEPAELRERLVGELRRALAKYEGPGPVKARREKSTPGRTGRLRHAETGGE